MQTHISNDGYLTHTLIHSTQAPLGGQADKNEKRIDTCYRECYEELGGMIPLAAIKLMCNSSTHKLNTYTAGKYVMKMVELIPSLGLDLPDKFFKDTPNRDKLTAPYKEMSYLKWVDLSFLGGAPNPPPEVAPGSFLEKLLGNKAFTGPLSRFYSTGILK